jgi:hypothetical protein
MEKSFINELEKQQIRREMFHTGFLKQVLLVSCTLLGIASSFGSYNNTLAVIIFRSMLSLNALGILCVGVVLFLQVRFAMILEKQTKEYIQETLRNQIPDEIPFVKTPICVFWIEYCGYAMIVLSIFLLVAIRFVS